MDNAVEWNAMSQEAKDEVTEKFSNNEQNVRAYASLCTETLDMISFLTSDEVIRGPFLLDQILPRFVSMLMNVMGRLSGSRSLDIKVKNMESYNFRPKEMLGRLCEILAHFVDLEKFSNAVANDGFYDSGSSLKRGLGVATKFSLLCSADHDAVMRLQKQVEAAHASSQDLDSLTNDAPEEFLDPLLCTIMKDPVLLPTSNNIVDRATIEQQLLNDPLDPFNRKPLTPKMLEPATDLKQRIKAWLISKGVVLDKIGFKED
jgi:ubiquitin conjugation factor E4 B